MAKRKKKGKSVAVADGDPVRCPRVWRFCLSWKAFVCVCVCEIVVFAVASLLSAPFVAFLEMLPRFLKFC